MDNLFYFPQNAVYFIALSFSIHIIFMFFINHVHELKYQTGDLKVTWKILHFTTSTNII